MFIIPLFPLRFVYFIGNITATLDWYFFSKARKRVERNLAGLPHLADDEIKKAVKTIFRCSVLNYIDLFRLPKTPIEEVDKRLKVHRTEYLEAALARGKGVIMVTSHIGNFDYAIQWLIAHGYTATIPVENIRPVKLFNLVKNLRASKGIHFVPVDSSESMRTIVKTLKDNGIVLLVIDRYIAGKAVKTELFGKEYLIPSGPIELALQMDSAVLGVCTWRTHGIYSEANFWPPIVFEQAESNQIEAAHAAMITKLISEQISAHYDQWMNFSNVWPDQNSVKELAEL